MPGKGGVRTLSRGPRQGKNCDVINMHTAGGPGNMNTELGDCPSSNKGIVIIIITPVVHIARECDIVPRYFNEVR